MCPADDSHLTFEFADYFVIKPTIQFAKFVDFKINKLDEKGQSVEQGFEYSSGTNEHFLGHEEIVAFNNVAGF
jgi:UDP-N-acetylglucosamine 4,6-dehydratase